MKTVTRSLDAKPYIVALIAAAPLVAVTQNVNAQTSVPPSSVASPSVSSLTKAAPAKTYNRTLNADLRAAVKSQNVSQVRSLLSRNADPNARDLDQWITPALFNAADKGNLEIVRALVEANADLEAQNVHGSSPLHAAISGNRLEVVQYLLQKGANLESNKNGGTALMTAALMTRTEIVRVLIKAGADVNARSSINQTALITVCGANLGESERLEIAKILVEANADVSAKDDLGKNAHETAAANRLFEVNKYLVGRFMRDLMLYNVTYKAIGELKTATSSTRLARWQEIKAELAKGANPRFTDSEGVTTLTNLIIALSPLLATLDEDDATMKTIIARSDLNAQTKDGAYTALHAAVDYENARVVSWLINAGANVNLVDAKNRTPLDFATEYKRQNVITLLKNAGAKTSATPLLAAPSATSSTRTPTPTPQSTPVPQAKPQATSVKNVAKSPLDVLRSGGKSELMQAAYDDNTTKIAQLLKRGASIDFANGEGHTPLFFAAYGGSAAAIKALVKAGADINYLDTENKTPLVSASFAAKVATIRALVEAGADLKYLQAAIGYAEFGKNTAVIEYLSSLKTQAKKSAAKSPAATSSTRS